MGALQADVQDWLLRAVNTAKSIRDLPYSSTTNTHAVPTRTRSTAEPGKESATVTLRRILCVSGALRKDG